MNRAAAELRWSGMAAAPKRSGAFAASVVVHAVALTLLIHFWVERPDLLQPAHDYQVTELVAPTLTATKPPKPVVPLHPPPRPLLERIAPKSPPAPQLQLPVERPALANTPPPAPALQPPKPEVVANTFPSAMPGPPGNGSPKTVVKTDSFNSGSSAVANLNKPAREVQTGGFGDPNGVPANANSHGTPNIAKVGGFDLPSGPGQGNGYGGAKGARGTVASAGFGDGVAGPGGSSHGEGLGRGGSLREAGFGDGAAAAPAVAQKPERPAEPKVVPAEIISKPTPQYTAEARQQKIEGEVLLEVEFSASGRVRVLRILRGLGHGLDEAAVRAAERIQFKPAQREGRSVDSTGKLHIIFQLA